MGLRFFFSLIVALLAVVCSGVTADDGSFLQVQAASEDDLADFTIEGVSRADLQLVVNKSGIDKKTIDYVTQQARKLMQEMGGPPSAGGLWFRKNIDSVVQEAKKKLGVENHPVAKLFAKKSTRDQMLHALEASTRDILDTLKGVNASVEDSIHHFLESNGSSKAERFMRLADEATRSLTASLSSVHPEFKWSNPFYLQGHDYDQRLTVEGKTSCQAQSAFRYRMLFKLDPADLLFKKKDQCVAGFYRATDGTQIYGGDIFDSKTTRTGYWGMRFPWTKPTYAPTPGCDSSNLKQWVITLDWGIHGVKYEGPPMGPLGKPSTEEPIVRIKLQWVDNSGLGGAPMKIEDVILKWDYQHLLTYPIVDTGSNPYEGALRLQFNNDRFGFLYQENLQPAKRVAKVETVVEAANAFQTSARRN